MLDRATKKAVCAIMESGGLNTTLVDRIAEGSKPAELTMDASELYVMARRVQEHI